MPIVWGGYFPSLYTDAALNARYVDFAIRGQGEETLPELLAALRKERKFATVRGLSYKDDFGLHVHNADRPLRSPNDFPLLPYHRLQDVGRYLLPTFLGTRTAVHQASIGCPFRCQFCGVVPIFDGRQKMEAPERTASTLSYLKTTYGANAVQFYDNNFFLNESHAREQAERLIPLGMRWWAEGRIDTVLRYSDATWRAIRRSGATMIFFGAESGSDEVLVQMNKKITTSQTLELAARIRRVRHHPRVLICGRQSAESGARHARHDRVYPAAEEAESGCRNHRAALHPDAASGRNVRRDRRQDRVSRHARGMGELNDGTTSPPVRIRIFRGFPGA